MTSSTSKRNWNRGRNHKNITIHNRYLHERTYIFNHCVVAWASWISSNILVICVTYDDRMVYVCNGNVDGVITVMPSADWSRTDSWAGLLQKLGLRIGPNRKLGGVITITWFEDWFKTERLAESTAWFASLECEWLSSQGKEDTLLNTSEDDTTVF